jgi:hypothetical protein
MGTQSRIFFYTISYHHAKFHAFTPFCLILIEILFGHLC